LTTAELIQFLDPREVSGPKSEITGELCQDSRQVSDGDVFIAVKGMRTDGHNYINQALKAGASAIICERIPDDISTAKAQLIKVEDTKKILPELAQTYYNEPAKELIITGITGTNGKTTVTTLVYQILQNLGIPAALLGTVYQYIGDQKISSRLTTSDPVSLAKSMRNMVDTGAEHLVMEVSSHALDQGRVAGIPFRCAGFTNLTHDHLDYHGSMEAYADAKKILFDNLDAEAVAIINADDSYASHMIKNCNARIINFGFGADETDVPCEIISQNIFGTKIKVGDTRLQTSLVGRFNAYNAVQAYLTVKNLGYAPDAVASALAHANGAEGRLERVALDQSTPQPLIVVDYAHTPDALYNVLSTLKELKGDDNKLYVVFGAGGDRDRSKRPKMAEIAEKLADRVILTSDNPRFEEPEDIIEGIKEGFSNEENITVLVDRKEAIRAAVKSAQPDDIIAVTGKGHETYQEIKGKRIDFDDRKIARQALEERFNQNAKTGREVT